jgi:hypothetical protein
MKTWPRPEGDDTKSRGKSSAPGLRSPLKSFADHKGSTAERIEIRVEPYNNWPRSEA